MTLHPSGSLPRALFLALPLAPTTLHAQITDRTRLVAALDSAARAHVADSMVAGAPNAREAWTGLL